MSVCKGVIRFEVCEDGRILLILMSLVGNGYIYTVILFSEIFGRHWWLA